MKNATLIADFETKRIPEVKDGKPVMKDGKPVEKVVPKYLAGRTFPVIEMDHFWLKPEEKGGLGVMLGMQDYVRITYPNGDHTQYYHAFSYT